MNTRQQDALRIIRDLQSAIAQCAWGDGIAEDARDLAYILSLEYHEDEDGDGDGDGDAQRYTIHARASSSDSWEDVTTRIYGEYPDVPDESPSYETLYNACCGYADAYHLYIRVRDTMRPRPWNALGNICVTFDPDGNVYSLPFPDDGDESAT